MLSLLSTADAAVQHRELNHQNLNCAANEVVACPDCSAPSGGQPPCSGGPPACRTCDWMPDDGNGGTGTVAGQGVQAAALLGNVGSTTVGKAASSTLYTQVTINAGDDVYGPFEAGFSSQQDNILAAMGCSTGKGYVPGGIDGLSVRRRASPAQRGSTVLAQKRLGFSAAFVRLHTN